MTPVFVQDLINFTFKIKTIIFKNKHFFSFLWEFIDVEIDLFQEAITFKTTKSYIVNIYHANSKKWFGVL